jgi:hypothetical protein
VAHGHFRLLTAVVLLAFAAVGCQTYSDQVRSVAANWNAGKVDVAAKQFATHADNAAKSKDSIVWQLEAGTACRAAGRYSDSDRYLNAAAARMDEYDHQAKVKLGREALALMTNQQNLPYEGHAYDKIMAHTYLALNWMSKGQAEKARPELIRAYQCQQDAVDRNKRRLAQVRAVAQESSNANVIQQTMSSQRLADTVSSVTRSFEGVKGYADYVNPFTVYLDGIYFFHNRADSSDLERSRKSLTRAFEMSGDNKFILADIDMVNAIYRGEQIAPCTYVIFETGRSATFEQVRVDVPIAFNKIAYVGAAFPRLATHDNHIPSLNVSTSTTNTTTSLVANMDSIIARDFKNEWPIILTKTLVSMVAKAAASYSANDAAQGTGEFAESFIRFITMITQLAINIADTRSWTTLPKEIQVARIPTPPDRRLTVTGVTGAPVQLALVEGAVNVVYVKSNSDGSPLLVNQFKLK